MQTISVYAISAETVRQADWTPLVRHMPARMEKAERFRFEKDRLLCIGGGFLMRQVVGICDESALCLGEYGKPFAPGYPHFSLSHCGEWCILSKCDCEIGADIEKTDEKNLMIAPMICTPRELSWMNEDPLRRFTLLWTWKESLLKAVGRGLSLEPNALDVLPFAEDQPLSLNGQSWYARSDCMDDYCFSVCTSTPIAGLEWVELHPSEL